MDPALPAEPSPDPVGYYADDALGDAVGEFRQGSAGSRWALARYLVGRAIGESFGNSLLVVGLGVLVLAGLLEWSGHTFWAVLLAVAALGVLAVRALLRALLRRLTAADAFGPVEERLRAVVADTRSDVMRELRRLGLPSHTWTLPLLALRLVRRKRRDDTLNRLRGFDVDRVVPAARVDELHLLLRSAAGSPRGG